MPVGLVAVALGLLLTRPADPPGLTVRAEAVDPPAGLPAPVRDALSRDAAVVAGADGEPALTVWFRAEIPAQATAEQVKNGLTYREIPDGTLIGAVRFDRRFVDYRKQEIPAGTYALRLAAQPDLGDHAGTAPHPDFAVLVPADKESDADPVDLKALVKLSAAATGGDHPGVMLLFPHTGPAAGPELAGKGDGATALVVRRPVAAAGVKTALGFALTVAGHSKAR